MRKKISKAACLLFLAASGLFFSACPAWTLSMEAPAYRQKGSGKAAITIMEFSDFQCPNCARAQNTVKEIMKRYDGKVLVVFRHFPLRMHKWSRLAARAAEAAGEQKKFWEYHDLLFGEQSAWSLSEDAKPFFIQYAQKVGLDMKKFQADLDSDRLDANIQRDVDQAAARSVSVTPTFFINGNRLVGQSQLDAYGDQTIQKELNRK